MMSERGRVFVVACDSFKGTLGSAQAGSIVGDVLRARFPGADVRAVCLGDGGEGTARAIVDACGGEMRTCCAHDPLMRPIEAEFGLLPGDICVCEMASTTGLALLALGEADPVRASSYGFGELIGAALDAGARELYLCIGGSATNDAGMGAMRALGIRFLDERGCELEGAGGDLRRARSVDASGLDTRLGSVRARVLSDVTSPLLGPQGASLCFGPQKGASPETALRLEVGMRCYADVLEAHLGYTIRERPGAGAAGGMGAALMAFLDAEMASGAETALDLIGFNALLDGADACITGEGRLDGQTAQGKAVSCVARRCARRGVPCFAVAGVVEDGLDAAALGLAGVEACAGAEFTADQSRAHPAEALRAAAERLACRL